MLNQSLVTSFVSYSFGIFVGLALLTTPEGKKFFASPAAPYVAGGLIGFSVTMTACKKAD